jgi:hypothetical protein
MRFPIKAGIKFMFTRQKHQARQVGLPGHPIFLRGIGFIGPIRGAAVAKTDEEHGQLAFGDSAAAEFIGPGIARTEILHAHAVKAVQAFDGLVHAFAKCGKVPGGRTEKDLFQGCDLPRFLSDVDCLNFKVITNILAYDRGIQNSRN